MRPVEKGKHPTTPKRQQKIVLNDYKKAIPFLKERTGEYCHFCEMNHPTLAIEHIKPKEHFPRLINHWDNFLLICTYCNSRKIDRIPLSPYRQKYFWSHINNTLLTFKRNMFDFGKIEPMPQLSPEQKKRIVWTVLIRKLEMLIQDGKGKQLPSNMP